MRDWVALALVPGVGPRVFRQLIDRFGTPHAVLQAPYAQLLDIPGIGQTLAESILGWRRRVNVDDQLRRADRVQAEIVPLTSERYPPLLREISDAPPLLFVRGAIEPRDANAVAFVGARRPGQYGRQVTRYLASNCATFGFTVISGMAAGVDSEAHKAAMEAGGRTIAVLASGVDVPYPKFNADLMQQIIQHGAVISEFPMGASPEKGSFPQRNRIVSGLSLGVVVTAAAQRSGALVTARHALEQGREVMAVPGDIFSPISDGVHALLRDGATLVQDPFDIRGALEPYTRNLAPLMRSETGGADGIELSDDEKAVFNALSLAPAHIDDIMAHCDLSAARVSGVLLSLELRGIVRQMQGKHFVRATR